MTLEGLEPPSRKLVEAVSLADRPIPLDVAAALMETSVEGALELGERMVGAALVATAGDSFIPASADTVLRIAAAQSSVHVAYLYRELARAFTETGYAERNPGLVGGYLLKAGDAVAALPLVDTAVATAAARGAAQEVVQLIDAALSATEEEGLTPQLEARLRVERAKYFQIAGWSDRAADDLVSALRNLEGAARIDALGFLAAVEDDRQESQTAEVYAALALVEAAAANEPLKGGSLLLLQARVVQRIGFPSESEVMLSKGTAILNDGGSPYQRWLAVLNTGRVTLDRGSAVEATPLLERVFSRASDIAGLAAQADAAAWLARAQFLRGHPSEGLESVAAAMDLADATATSGPIFLGHMAEAEGAIRFAAYEQGLAAADAMLGYVLRQLPKWENAACYLRAKALLGLERVDEAAEEVGRALELTPEGINGWRWRLRIEAFGLSVLAAQRGEWQKQRAEDLTDELLQGQWLDVAADLMAVRARVEEDRELAKQSAALALRLGIPTIAAVAIEAGGLWSDPSSTVVASRVKETAHHVDADWHEAWVAQPEIAAALATPDVVDEELTVAALALQADLDAAMATAGLADPATALSPAQRRAQGLIRRRKVRRTAVWIGVAAALLLLVGGLALAFAGQSRIEDTRIVDLPEFFSGEWETFGGNQARTGSSNATGVQAPAGYYWRNDRNRDQFFASPIVLGQRVVIGSLDGQVYFYDRKKGDTISDIRRTGDRITMTAAGGKIRGDGESHFLAFVPGSDGLLRAYKMGSAEEVWKARIDVTGTPAVDGERALLYVGASDGFLYVLNAGSGATIDQWPPKGEVGLAGPISTDITLAGGKAYFGVGSQLWQLDVSTFRATQCELKTNNDFLTPVVSEGVIYAANSDGFVYFVDTEPCARASSSIPVLEQLTVKPSVHDGVIYQPGANGVIAYNLEGKRIWGPAPVRDGDVLAPTVQGSPAVAGGLVYFGADDGYVYALDAETGDLVWEWFEGVPISSSVAVTDGVVYVATSVGQVIAIGGEPGEAQPVPSTTTTPTTAPASNPGPGAG